MRKLQCYVAPEVEVLSLHVERGFDVSGDANPGEDGGELLSGKSL